MASSPLIYPFFPDDSSLQIIYYSRYQMPQRGKKKTRRSVKKEERHREIALTHKSNNGVLL